MNVIRWSEVADDVAAVAARGRLLPFFGAALSMYSPTSLPLGSGLLHSALQGIFPDKNLFLLPQSEWTVAEKTIAAHSPEVILQGLSESLLDRRRLADFYNRMVGMPHNALHSAMVSALLNGSVPAIFTTNQDQCFETAADDQGHRVEPLCDDKGFSRGLANTVYQFHGATGGDTVQEEVRRRDSLSFSLHSMGPHLSDEKHAVLRDGLEQHILLVLRYSGCDPDIWYSLDEILTDVPTARIYWGILSASSVPRHLARLASKHPASVTVFAGDMVDVLDRLCAPWGMGQPGSVHEDIAECQQRLDQLRSWAPGMPAEQRALTYGYVLDSVGLHQMAAEELRVLAETASDTAVRMLAWLFAGYASREVGQHHDACRMLGNAIQESQALGDRCRYAQAIHKIGESLSAFESVRFWHFWPHKRRFHAGAGLLVQAAEMYESIPPDELSAKQVGRSGRGNAILNLGQLYRRVARWSLPSRPLRDMAKAEVLRSIDVLKEERDLRVLPMAIAATADFSEDRSEKLAAINASIEYAEEWNQDDIQIGSAYFAKGQLLGPSDLESIACYTRALEAFQRAGMKAEIARTQLELAVVLTQHAARAIKHTQGSWEWKFGLRTLSMARLVLALLRRSQKG